MSKGARMSTDCTFCRIAAGEAPADDEFVAFRDAHPRAPVHLIVMPRQHVTSLDVVEQLGSDAAGRLLRFIAMLAREQGVHETGYRVVTNIGPDAGQEVFHLHWHLMGGRRLGDMA
ncbi:MAG TPA: histidine triad nucleotide-binding protein [Thermoleophilia bacterium]|nr:histidine triad nucleotide-binding protein [Thermoleophilia bacterium]